ncbi:MAG: hypothetical protein QE271_08465 [Bacteriovoracaceae bacterium]|nr:hypothetical protein [Bacteriovoracaceae bacterium]
MKIFLMLMNMFVFFIAAYEAHSQTELDQQLTITQDAINYLTHDIKSNEPSTLNVSDYRQWKENFNTKLEQKLSLFQSNLKQKIFGPLQEVTNRYLETYHDSHLSFDQKRIILSSLIKKMNSLKPFVEQEYSKALKDVYSWHDLLPYDFTFNAKDKSFFPLFLKNEPAAKKLTNVFDESRFNIKKNKIYYLSISLGYHITDIVEKFSLKSDHHVFLTISTPNVLNWEIKIGDEHYYEDIERKRNDYQYNQPEILSLWDDLRRKGIVSIVLQNGSYEQSLQRIIEGCISKSCIALKAADLAYYYVSIKNMLDKEILVKLPRIESVEPFVFTIQNLNFYIDSYLELLKRTDFSKIIEELPFDTNN